MLFEDSLDSGGVIERDNQGVFGEILGDTGRGGNAESGESGAGGSEEVIGMAVVAPGEFDNLVAFGISTGEPNG